MNHETLRNIYFVIHALRAEHAVTMEKPLLTLRQSEVEIECAAATVPDASSYLINIIEWR